MPWETGETTGPVLVHVRVPRLTHASLTLLFLGGPLPVPQHAGQLLLEDQAEPPAAVHGAAGEAPDALLVPEVDGGAGQAQEHACDETRRRIRPRRRRRVGMLNRCRGE